MDTKQSAKTAQTTKTDAYSKRKEQLLESAAKLINQKGFLATSMNDIARQLGMNKASLYHYCKSKDEIAIEIEHLNYAYVKHLFAEADSQCDNGLDKLRHFFIGYVKLMTTPIGAAGVQIVSFPHSTELENRHKSFFRDVDNKVQDFIIEGQQDGSIAQVNRRWSDFLMFGALHWIPRWYSHEANLSPDQLAEELFDVLIQGLLPR